MASDKYSGPERRNYMRLDTDCAVDYIKLSSDLKPTRDVIDDSYSRNISGAGIKFTAVEKVPMGSFLELHIKIPTVNKFLTATGKVVRCDAEQKGKFGVAVSFIWINKKDRELIDEYVRNKRLEKLRSKIKE